MDKTKCREYFGGSAGRQTGSVQWRATRGELGAAAAHPAAALADAHPGAKSLTRPSPATCWRRSPAPGDRGGRLHDAGCLVRGAAVRASGDNPPAETADKVLPCKAAMERPPLSCCPATDICDMHTVRRVYRTCSLPMCGVLATCFRVGCICHRYWTAGRTPSGWTSAAVLQGRQPGWRCGSVCSV